MRCMSCEADIPPQWVNAIQSNQCPGCGGEIMNQAAKELLDELTQAMASMPNNPQGLAGWLLSNYHFRKIGSAEPTERFHTKTGKRQRHQDDDDVDMSNLKVPHNPVQELLKRTDAYKNIQATRAKLGGRSRRDQLAQMAAGIADVDADMYGTGLPDSVQVEYDDDDEPVERGPKLSRHLETGVSLTDASVAPLSLEELQELGNAVVPEAEETAHQVLQAQRLKRLKAQSDIASGGGIGSFRRSG